MEKNLPKDLTAVWADVQYYFKVRLEMLKMAVIESGAKLTADLITNTIVVITLLLAFLAGSVTLAFYLSALFDSYTLGFGCTTIFFTLSALLIGWKKLAIENFIAGLVIRRYFTKHCEAKIEQRQWEEKYSAGEVVSVTKSMEAEIVEGGVTKDEPRGSETTKKHKLTWRVIWEILKNSFEGFGDHKVTKLSGSLAYYTVFSMAPLLVVVISLCGLFLGEEAARGQIYSQLSGFIGADTALQLQEIVKKASIGDKGTVAFIIGTVTLLVGATTVFSDIQDSINTIWGLKPKPKRGWLKMLQNRFLSFSVIISLGFLLLVSLAVTSLLDGFSSRLQVRFSEVSVVVFYILNQVVTLSVISLIFGVIFKVLPDAEIKWRDVAFGALVTAVLFMIGKFGISVYIGQSDVGSTYGAGGSLIVLLLWTYYSSLILYFGAEFTKSYAIARGSEIRPSHYAVTTRQVEVVSEERSVQENEEKAARIGSER